MSLGGIETMMGPGSVGMARINMATLVGPAGTTRTMARSADEQNLEILEEYIKVSGP